LIVAKCAQATKAPQKYRLGSYLGGAAFVNGSDAMAVGLNRDLALFDLNEGKIRRRLHRGESRIGGVEVESVNKRVAVGTWDGKVKIWTTAELLEGNDAGQQQLDYHKTPVAIPTAVGVLSTSVM
jgi:WD40 repeat protein